MQPNEWGMSQPILNSIRTRYMKERNTKYKIQNVFFLQFWSVAKTLNSAFFPFPSLIFLAKCTEFCFAGLVFFFFMPVSLFIRLMISVAVVQIFLLLFLFIEHSPDTMHLWIRWTIIQNILLFFPLFIFYFSSFHYNFLAWHDLVRILLSIILLFRFGSSVHTSTSMPHKYFVLSLLFSTLRFE